jgi:hypothetical protein
MCEDNSHQSQLNFFSMLHGLHVFRVVIGLLTGHNMLRQHLYVMGLSDNPICKKCGAEVLKRKSQFLFYVHMRPWLHSDTHF